MMNNPVTWLLMIALYFMPYIVASAREKRNKGAIGALNFFLGWTLIGWVIALVWALCHDESPSKAAS
ncbi:MAG TPA: superinfection immunity protein [Terriglobia bacterium]|nr:superinfection immunity protein [Terriglobia bacterium]